MKLPLAFLLACMSVCILAMSQNRSEIRVVGIAPSNVSCDPALKKEIDSLGKAENTDFNEGWGKYVPERELTETEKRSIASIRKFGETLDFYKMITAETIKNLFYFLRDHFDDKLMLQQDVTASGRSALRQIAVSAGAEFVVNFPELAFYKKDGEPSMRVVVELYDLSHDSIVLKKEFTGNTLPRIFMEYCGKKTLGCLVRDGGTTIASSLFDAMSTVHPVLAAHKKEADAEKTLYEKRSELLTNVYHKKQWNASRVRDAIKPTDSSINLDDLYCVVENNDKTKFMAFFIGKPVGDSPLPVEVKAKAYIVAGMKSEGQWHYIKQLDDNVLASSIEDARIFLLNELQHLQFFNYDDTSFDPDFWETGAFSKGIFGIVAQSRVADATAARNNFAKNIYDKFIRPANMEPLYDEYDQLILIHPADQSVAISIVKVKDRELATTLRYYVIIPAENKMYEWTRLNSLRNNETGFVKQISELADKMPYFILEDKKFWKDHVLLKQNGQYKYLKSLQ